MIRSVILLLLLFPIIAQAQLGDRKISWTSSESINLLSGDNLQIELKFVSHGDHKIELIQKRMAEEFIITSFSGVWDDLNEIGSLVYQIKDDTGGSGEITLGRTAKELFLILDLSKSSSTGIKQRFILSGYTVY